MTKNKKSLIMVVVVLGVITALATSLTGNKSLKSINVLHTKPSLQRTSSDIGVMVEDMPQTETSDQSVAVIAPQYRRRMPPVAGGDALDVDERIYQKYSNYSLVVSNVSDYMRQLKEYFLSIEGRILSSSLSSTDKYQHGLLTAKLPVAKFEEANARVVSNVDKIMSENVNAQDKTGQYVSATEAIDELNTKKLEKEIELEEAKTDAQKKRIQLEITRLESQIKTAEQRLESVEAKVEYATLTVQVANNERYFNPQVGGTGTLKEEMLAAWESVSGIIYFLARFAIWVLIYGIVWLPIVLVLKYLSKKLRRQPINPV